MCRLGEEIVAFASDRLIPFSERLEVVELGVAALGERLKEFLGEPKEEEEEFVPEEEGGESLTSLLEEPLPAELALWAEKLRKWAEEAALFFPSGFQPEDRPERISGVSLSDLLTALEEVWEKARARESLALPSRRMDFGEAVRFILQLLRRREKVRFVELFPPDADRSAVVTTFVALLELWRRGKVRVLEDGGDIYLSRRP